MRPFNVILAAAAAGLAVAVVPASAQSASAATEATSTTSAGATGPANTAISDRYMTSVQTELTSKVDSKNASVGQQVTAKTTQSAKLADGTTLPKGTKLVGHVTQVQAQSKGQAYSALGFAFDHAELKGGQTVPLRSVIRAAAPPVNAGGSAQDSMMADEQMGPVGTNASAGGMGGGSARSGGGLGGGGGLVGGTVRGAGQTAGGLGQAAGQTAGGAARTAGTTLGDTTADARTMTQATANAGAGMVTQAGENLSAAARATALPGVMLTSSGSANASGTLMASGRNISLESGTQITLGLITQ